MGAEAPAIVSSMLDNMTAAIDEVEHAVGDGDLDRATSAAHRCRNDALMLGARQLLAALTDLEAATRQADVPVPTRHSSRCGWYGRRRATSWQPARTLHKSSSHESSFRALETIRASWSDTSSSSTTTS